MITRFATVYAGHIDLPDMGQMATPANERRYSNEQLAGVFAKTDVVAKTMDGPKEAGFLYVGGGHFLTDRQGATQITDAALRQLATCGEHEVTYTCTPPGSGIRMGIDRDGDGFLDGDEQDAGSNPADPGSMP